MQNRHSLRRAGLEFCYRSVTATPLIAMLQKGSMIGDWTCRSAASYLAATHQEEHHDAAIKSARARRHAAAVCCCDRQRLSAIRSGCKSAGASQEDSQPGCACRRAHSFHAGTLLGTGPHVPHRSAQTHSRRRRCGHACCRRGPGAAHARRRRRGAPGSGGETRDDSQVRVGQRGTRGNRAQRIGHRESPSCRAS
jgi:hypothetical protein